MRRLSAPLHALFALWFAVVLGDPGMLHSCAMHGAGHGGHAAVAPANAGHDMAGMGHDVAPAAPHDQAPPACSCVGHCCAASTPAPLPTVTTLAVPTVQRAPEPPSAAPARPAPAAPEHRLPFANGPPAL